MSQTQIKLIIDPRCVMCHCAQVQKRNLALHSPELIRQYTLSVLQQVSVQCQAVSDTPEQRQDGHKGTIVFTNASAALKGYPRSGAFAAASHGKAGLAQSMARELMPQGIHVAHVPIDAAIGWEQPNGSRAHRLAGEAVDDNLAHPDRIAELLPCISHQHDCAVGDREAYARLEHGMPRQ